MSTTDPFGLPDGYGGIRQPGDSESPLLRPWSDPAPTARTDALHGVADGGPPPLPPPAANPRAPFTLPPDSAPPPRPPSIHWRWVRRGLAAFALLLMLTIGWLAWTAPLSKSLQPIAPPQLTLVSADGRPIARHGAIVDRPVDVANLPPHVVEAFLAVEDRRFYSHWGLDPRGLARAMWNNITSGSTQGGSTITQQLAKFTFLNSDRTYTRKAREVLIAFWMEAWLTKDEILSRYLSNAYFGDNVYGLRAASLHYFYRRPERLTLTQAAMLAGMVQAPSRLAPTRNLRAAQRRERIVLNAMVDAGYLTATEAARVRPATVDHRARPALPAGTYFADWAMPQARATIERSYEEQRVTTTLDARLQDIARRAVAGAPLGRAQVALVAMRPNGEVVAMVGGRSYADSPFNRATQARRQPGSTFKLVVYYAALRSGMTPETLVDDSPITTGTYRPANAGGRYRGAITLREAFARSSNVVAVRLYQQLGSAAVNDAARDLGITSELPDNASVALGSAGTTLLELTSAYAAVAANETPVEPHAIRRPETGWIDRLFDGRTSLNGQARTHLLELLQATVNEGTGRAARLAIPAYGKTGTTQDSRDALFVGFAGDLVVGVWIGNDDNSPLRGASGGGVPARIWREFMVNAIPGAAPRRAAQPPPSDTPSEIFDDLPLGIAPPQVRIDPKTGIAIETTVGGLGVTLDRDGIAVAPTPEVQDRIDTVRRRAEELEAAATGSTPAQ